MRLRQYFLANQTENYINFNPISTKIAKSHFFKKWTYDKIELTSREAEQGRIKKINFYFCGLHYVVGLADQAEGALMVFDRLLYNEGNRFNIIFYNAGIVYYLQKKCKKVFNVFEENRLLAAVHYDLNVPSFIAGCRALGLIGKLLTGPLWRLLVQVKNLLELNKYY